MSVAGVESTFVERLSEYLVSLPYDLKILQEAVTDPDLEKPIRLMAACTVVHTMLPQEGEPGPLRYVDDVLFVRMALDKVGEGDSEGAVEFRRRFDELYARLPEDLKLFSSVLGDLWPWLSGKVAGFGKLSLKGKKAAQAVDDEEIATFFYDEGLAFQTNYTVTEEQVANKFRRAEQVIDLLRKRYDDDKKKIA
ncbi:MAG: hypothetical protein ABI321_21340 [Polyangia bacterium]